jgi:hypothetical protein
MSAGSTTLQSAAAAAEVDEAATQALDLVRQFATTSTNDPDQMYAELDRARTKVMNAWERLERLQQQAMKENNNAAPRIQDDDVRPAFMDMITDAFADVLEDLRNKSNDEDLDVDVLVDCLQSGMDLLPLLTSSSYEQGDFSWSNKDDDDDDNNNDPSDSNLDTNCNNDDDDNPHEQRRRRLGYHCRDDNTNADPEAAI